MRMRERTKRGVSERQDDISAGPLSSHPSDFYSSSSFSFFFLVCFLIFKLHFTYLLWCREDRTQDPADGRQPLHHCATPSAPTFVLDRPPNRSLSLHCPVSPLRERCRWERGIPGLTLDPPASSSFLPLRNHFSGFS